MSSYEDRFNALVAEAEADYEAALADVRALLSQAEDRVEALRSKGISVRCELPMGAGVRLDQMRFSAEFSKRLKA